jgi:pimeloyl-ACP methyl ester carboxylesterase
MFVGGERDPVLNWPGTRALVDTLGDCLIPDLRASVILDGCGHWIPQERPGETNDLLLDFLVGH